MWWLLGLSIVLPVIFSFLSEGRAYLEAEQMWDEFDLADLKEDAKKHLEEENVRMILRPVGTYVLMGFIFLIYGLIFFASGFVWAIVFKGFKAPLAWLIYEPETEKEEKDDKED